MRTRKESNLNRKLIRNAVSYIGFINLDSLNKDIKILDLYKSLNILGLKCFGFRKRNLNLLILYKKINGG
jgi:hypothetical protein